MTTSTTSNFRFSKANSINTHFFCSGRRTAYRKWALRLLRYLYAKSISILRFNRASYIHHCFFVFVTCPKCGCVNTWPCTAMHTAVYTAVYCAFPYWVANQSIQDWPGDYHIYTDIFYKNFLFFLLYWVRTTSMCCFSLYKQRFLPCTAGALT